MDRPRPNLASTEIREETAEQEKPVNLLPRAVLRYNAYLLLDGEWKFAVDKEDVGLKERWPVQHHYDHTVTWPGSVESHMAKARGETREITWRDTVVAWYERTFELPQRTAEQSHLMFQITFGACGYDTRVWLNGFPLKTIEGEEVHYGEYTSFSYELDEDILVPVNRITVRIAETMDAEIPRGKQESSVYKRGGIWYHTYTGAVRSVWLEMVERNRLRSRVSILSIVEDQLVRFNVTPHIHDAGDYVIRLSVYELDDHNGEPMATSEYPIFLDRGEKNQRLVLKVPGAQPWSPEQPYRYRLVAELIHPDGYSAEIQAHFGLRKIEARGRYIYLNNRPVYLDGILYQPGTATFAQMKEHLRSMKALGCNIVRVHIAGIDPRVYNLADELGLLLWVEVPSPHRSSRQSRKNHRDELMRMLSLIGTNPSVVIWSLYNEDWGAQDIASNAETREYIIDTYHYMKIFYPQFLVIDNDGWHHLSLEGKLKSDLLTVHIYTPDLQTWKEMLDKLSAGEMKGVAAFPLVVGDPFFYRGQVPIVVSEWGGFGFPEYGGPKDLTARAERIRLFKKELRNRRIAGDVYTQATNIEEERNGLIETASGELLVPEDVLSSE